VHVSVFVRVFVRVASGGIFPFGCEIVAQFTIAGVFCKGFFGPNWPWMKVSCALDEGWLAPPSQLRIERSLHAPEEYSSIRCVSLCEVGSLVWIKRIDAEMGFGAKGVEGDPKTQMFKLRQSLLEWNESVTDNETKTPPRKRWRRNDGQSSDGDVRGGI
jgi:hypothetical protein